MGAKKGNQNAAKPEEKRVSGKGRVVIDLGPLKARVERRLQPGQSLKSFVVEALEERLKQ